MPQGQTYPFRTWFGYVRGSVPDFRVGILTLSPEGVLIQGKAVVRSEIQVPILMACLLLRFGFLIAYVALEYGFRRDAALSVPWVNVSELVLVPKKNRVCLVYTAPNYKGVMKTFSLAFKLNPTLYAAFVDCVGQSVPERVHEGKIRAWTSPKAWVFLGGILVGLSILLAVFLLAPHSLLHP